LTLLDNVPDAIARFDQELRHVYVNRATAEANQRSVADFLGRTMRDMGHSEEISSLIEDNLRKVFATGERHSFEVEFAGPHGLRFYETLMAPESGRDGRIDYVVVVSRDITPQRRAQSALAIAERTTSHLQLVSQLAHEINNPLMAAVNAMYLLRRGQSDAGREQHLEILAEQIDRIAEVTRQMLKASDSEA
jgi:PAS domain S-box-containing protein